ncbi:hypothetical protein [Salinimonas lutimaris]|uniref:hypothetical protein n=1 Tax=Salinimonas lutimaris TaxID=914153 RepID=UPI0010C0CBDC|nr:hypothetical protein [Salinimonas lutimaris]
MKASTMFNTALISSVLLGGSAMAQQSKVEDVVTNMLGQLMASTTLEIQMDVQEAIANTVYFFEPESTHSPRGSVSVKDLSASNKAADAEQDDEQVQ